MKKIIVLVSSMIITGCLSYQFLTTSMNQITTTDRYAAFDTFRPLERQLRPLKAITITTPDEHVFTDSKVHDDTRDRMYKEGFRHEINTLDEPDALIPRSALSPKNVPAPYPLEKRYTQ